MDKEVSAKLAAIDTALSALSFRIGFQRGINGDDPMIANMEAAMAELHVMKDEILFHKEPTGTI